MEHLIFTILAQGSVSTFPWSWLPISCRTLSQVSIQFTSQATILYNFNIHIPPHFMTCHWSWRNNFPAFVKKKDHFSAPVAICKRKISNLQGKILQSVQLLISAFFFSVNFIQLASFIEFYFPNISFRTPITRESRALGVWDIWLSFSLMSVENTIQSLGIVTPLTACRTPISQSEQRLRLYWPMRSFY